MLKIISLLTLTLFVNSVNADNHHHDADWVAPLIGGIVIGGMLVLPFIRLIGIFGKILVDHIMQSNNCLGDCNQGRLPCNCRGEKHE